MPYARLIVAALALPAAFDAEVPAADGRYLATSSVSLQQPSELPHSEQGVFASSFDDGLLAQTRNLPIDLANGLSLPARLYGPVQPNGAAVVMTHGCSGMWRHDEPWTVAQGAIEKWGQELARNGYFALAIDSYTSRAPAGVDPRDFQRQCSGDVHDGAVDPYTTRVEDMDEAIAWLRYRLGIAATSRLGALGWSQGAQSVLVRSAETYVDQNVSRFDDSADETTSLLASVAFYPGCGTHLGFVEGSGVESSFWRPHRDLRLNHGGADPLHASCAQRSEIAVGTYGSVPESGHAVWYIEYPNAHHSFDGAITEWPATRCAPGTPPSDICAASDADISSLEFLSARLAPHADP